jgi:ATP-dependent Clp protease ATP-binding subunit ClpX
MTYKKFPSPEEIQKEFEEFMQKRFGAKVHIIGVSQDGESKPKPQPPAPKKKPLALFQDKPKDIKAYLDLSVIGQDEAKKALAIALCDHYNHIQAPQDGGHYVKQNILLIGPTGVGKTYMIKQLAKKIGVPFVKADATKFSETGYVGANVEDLIKDLVQEADGDLEAAQYGIVYLDEGDKLASRSGPFQGKDVNGRGVQTGLLKLMEETEVDVRAGQDPISQIQAYMEMQQKGHVEKQVVSTKHILFILSGAFQGIDEIIAKRLNKNAIGFGSELASRERQQPSEILKEVQTEDLIGYGFEPEFVGRLPVRVVCDPLDRKALYHILKDSEGSLIRQYEKAFSLYGIKATFEEDALWAIAEKALLERTGARGLMTVCERIFRDFKYELPSTDCQDLLVTRELIQSPREVLNQILGKVGPNFSKEQLIVHDFEKKFSEIHGMKIQFDKESLLLIIDQSKTENLDLVVVCERILQGYEYGLKLIEQNTGQKEFFLSKESVTHPKIALEKMIRDSYQFPTQGKDENI